MANLLYIEKLPSNIAAPFAAKVIDIASFLQIDPNWLMQVMYAESRLNSQAQNRISKDKHLVAAGLIQWTKASGLPGAPESVLQMTALEQLDKVKLYFAPYRGKLKSYFDVYLVTFFPAAVGKADDYIFKTSRLSAAIIAAQNPIINRNKDGNITMREFKEYVSSTMTAKIKEIIFKVKDFAQANPVQAAGGGIGLIAIAAFFF